MKPSTSTDHSPRLPIDLAADPVELARLLAVERPASPSWPVAAAR